MKKLCAAVLSLLLCLSILPLAALGEESGTTTTTTSGETSSTEPAGKLQAAVELHVDKEGKRIAAIVSLPEQESPAELVLTLLVDGEEKEEKPVSESGEAVFDYPLQIGVDEEITVRWGGGESPYERGRASVTVEYTPEEILGFEFQIYSRDYQKEVQTFTMSWNASDKALVTAIIVNGVEYSAFDVRGNVTALNVPMKIGSNRVAYVLTVETGTGEQKITWKDPEPFIVSGTLRTSLSLSQSGTTVTAVLTDEQGDPVPDHPLVMYIGGSEFSKQTTDEDGAAVFSGVPAGEEVRVAAESRMTSDGVSYEACEATLSGGDTPTSSQGPATTTGQATSPVVTKKPTTRNPGKTTTAAPTTTARTYATVRGAGTTSTEGDKIVLNVSYDTGVRDAFGLKDNDFQNKARFLLGQDTYASLMGGSNGTLMLMARTSPILVTDQQVSAAISNISKFSPYHAENILRVTLDLGLLFINADGSEAESSAAPEAGYTIQLPIPKEMQDVKLIAVAATNEDAIATPVEATIENGSIRFDTKYLSTFTILGFSEAKSGSISKTPTVAVVLIVVGALMLIGAVLLFYFFVLRRPGGGNGDGTGTGPDGAGPQGGSDPLQAAEPVDSPLPIVPPKPGMEDIYSSDSRRPQPPVHRPFQPPAGQPSDPPQGGVSLGSFQDFPRDRE